MWEPSAFPAAVPAIWVYTAGGDFNAVGRPLMDWLRPEQKARVERLRQASLLFQGKHRQYFLEEGRTQFDFPEVRTAGVPFGRRGGGRMYITDNVLRLISLKNADLLFGQEPIIRVDDAIQQDYLARLVERSNLHQVLYNAAVECSYQGEAFLESCVVNGEVYVRRVLADGIFPVGALGADGQYAAYVEFSLENVGLKDHPIWLLSERHFLKGRIEWHVYQLGDNGKRMQEIALNQWPGWEEKSPPPVQASGIERNTITWVPNLLSEDRPVSDYDGLVELQDALNAKMTQLARVLAKHADPKMALPADSFGPEGNVRSDYDAWPFRTKDDVPQYITWDAQLDAAQKDRQFVLNQLLVQAETSPALLGLKEGAAPDAYKKVRLESFNSLAKAQRKATFWRAAIRRAVSVAQDLENATPGYVRYDRYPIGVEMRDGIPADDVDLASKQATLKASGLISTRGALIERLGDPAAVEQELAEIQREQREAMPSILLGEAREAPTPAPATAPATAPADAAAESAMAEQAAEDVQAI